MRQYTGFGSRSLNTPQSEPIPGREADMAENNAGGFSFVIDDMSRLNRFLVLGSTGGTYYVSERKLTKQNLDIVEALLKVGRGKEVVDAIVAISDQGRAPSNDPALFALARCCACDVSPSQPLKDRTGKEMGKDRRILHPDDIAVRQYAYAALPKVVRTGTHLLHFLEYVKQFRGRGPIHDHAIEAWYNKKFAEKLAYQVVKYQSRDGWSQRDVLRLARPKPGDSDHNAIYHWVTKGWDATPSEVIPSEQAMGLIWAFERAKHTSEPNEIADLILKYRLPREAVPTESLKSVKVWEALLEDMPMEAMTRNLATMTRNGVLVPMGTMTAKVIERLRSQEAIQKARLHPIKLLAALMTYQSGRSIRGDGTWTPIPQIADALNDAFYLAFKCVEPSNKRILLALDVSGSMSSGMVAGVPGLTPRVASSAIALVTAAVEPNWAVMAFSSNFIPLSISSKQRLDDVVRMTAHLPFQGTDCALPMLWAIQGNVDVDAFVVLTDNETWQGSIHAAQALQMYRQKTGIPAKLIVVGMTATQFSIADPKDAGMLDVVGCDTNTPSLISEFIAGRF